MCSFLQLTVTFWLINHTMCIFLARFQRLQSDQWSLFWMVLCDPRRWRVQLKFIDRQPLWFLWVNVVTWNGHGWIVVRSRAASAVITVFHSLLKWGQEKYYLNIGRMSTMRVKERASKVFWTLLSWNIRSKWILFLLLVGLTDIGILFRLLNYLTWGFPAGSGDDEISMKLLKFPINRAPLCV